MENNISSPLKLTFNGEYKVNKPLDQSGEYVDLAFALELEQKNKTLMELVEHLSGQATKFERRYYLLKEENGRLSNNYLDLHSEFIELRDNPNYKARK